MMNCIECPWFESCDELDQIYCMNDKLNQVKTKLEEMEENKMTNEQAIEILANARYADDLQGNEDLTTAHYMAIKALEQAPKALQFANWVATEIFDENWEYNKDAFDELACRKLAKLEIVRAKGNEWELVELQESEET